MRRSYEVWRKYVQKYPKFENLQAHKIFSIDDEGRVDASFCLAYGDYEALRYISYALTRVLKTP